MIDTELAEKIINKLPPKIIAVIEKHIKKIPFINKIYAISSQSNPLHSDLWPSASKYESEIVSMTSD